MTTRTMRSSKQSGVRRPVADPVMRALRRGVALATADRVLARNQPSADAREASLLLKRIQLAELKRRKLALEIEIASEVDDDVFLGRHLDIERELYAQRDAAVGRWDAAARDAADRAIEAHRERFARLTAPPPELPRAIGHSAWGDHILTDGTHRHADGSLVTAADIEQRRAAWWRTKNSGTTPSLPYP